MNNFKTTITAQTLNDLEQILFSSIAQYHKEYDELDELEKIYVSVQIHLLEKVRIKIIEVKSKFKLNLSSTQALCLAALFSNVKPSTNSSINELLLIVDKITQHFTMPQTSNQLLIK